LEFCRKAAGEYVQYLVRRQKLAESEEDPARVKIVMLGRKRQATPTPAEREDNRRRT